MVDTRLVCEPPATQDGTTPVVNVPTQTLTVGKWRLVQ